MRARHIAWLGLFAIAACSTPATAPDAAPTSSGGKLVNTTPQVAIPSQAAINAIMPGEVECKGLSQVGGLELSVASTDFLAATGATPAHCLLKATLGPKRLALELRLPKSWTGKFLLSPGAAGLARGYAVLSVGEPTDDAALGEAIRRTRGIVADYYGAQVTHSYVLDCARAGLLQRFSSQFEAAAPDLACAS